VSRLTLDELAQRSGVTSRNIRNFQSHGLLPPPVREGRVGFYDESHVARLELVRTLQDRGYSRAAIRDLLRTWEAGGTVGDVLGIEGAMLGFPGDEARTFTVAELDELFTDDPVQRQRSVDLGMLRLNEDGTYTAPSIQLLEVGIQLVALGVPLASVIDLAEQVITHARATADAFLQFFDEHVWQPALRSSPSPPPADLAGRLAQLHPVPSIAVARALELALAESARAERLPLTPES
jgi:DNA-binding transcriptional MerR regulator